METCSRARHLPVAREDEFALALNTSSRRALHGSLLCLLAVTLPGTVRAQDQSVAASRQSAATSTAVDRAYLPTDGATATANSNTVLAAHRLNNGAAFYLICRGGPGLRIDTRDGDLAPAWMNLPPWVYVATLVVDFSHSLLPPDRSGRNLQPGQCSPADFQFRDSDPTQIRQVMTLNGQWEQAMKGLPEDTSPNVAQKYPDLRNTPAYLRDPSHYWKFGADDDGELYLQSGSSEYWTTAMYGGPPPASPTATSKPHGSKIMIDAASGAATEASGRSDSVRAAINAVPLVAEPSICVLARSARARNSPAAPGLERQCRAAGGTP